MSILNRIPDNTSGCLIYGCFLLWVGVLLGIPSLIWDEQSVNVCGIIALTATLFLTIFDQFKISFIKDYPLTFAHLCYVVIYSISLSVSVICGADAELYSSVIVSVLCLLIAFVVDLIFYNKK